MRKKKTKKQKQEKEMDDTWSRIIKERAENRCEYCGKTGRLNAHHVWSRSNKAVRWDPDNGICLCVTHHTFGKFSAHGSPMDFAEWLEGYRGIGWFLRTRAKAHKTWDKKDLDKYYESLKECLN